MSSQPSPLSELSPELFPIIASHLPLYMTPPTLLSLALANRRISEIVLPILNSIWILKNDHDALKMIQRLFDEPEKGKIIRELHILTEISVFSRKNPFNDLEKIISAGKLPHIHSFGLYFSRRRRYMDVEGAWKLSASLWENLQKNCPRLRGLIVRGAPDLYGPDDFGMFELQNLTSLTLDFTFVIHLDQDKELFFQNLSSLSANLHTLRLQGLQTPSSIPLGDYVPVSLDPAINFPVLQSLTLKEFSYTNAIDAMDFWRRHPTLEYLDLYGIYYCLGWFTEIPHLDVESFLPNLKHFKGNFDDVRALTPILHRLTSLTVYETTNAQVLCLLRVVLPDGLPNLRSLSIIHRPRKIDIEDRLWRDIADGEDFGLKLRKIERQSSSEYILSLARGAPNLEELVLYAYFVSITHVADIALEMAQFSKLRRFYYQGLLADKDDILAENSKTLAERCRGLTVVVDMCQYQLPYVAARISRYQNGDVSNVVIGEGYGVQIGHEGEAFPH